MAEPVALLLLNPVVSASILAGLAVLLLVLGIPCCCWVQRKASEYRLLAEERRDGAQGRWIENAAGSSARLLSWRAFLRGRTLILMYFKLIINFVAPFVALMFVSPFFHQQPIGVHADLEPDTAESPLLPSVFVLLIAICVPCVPWVKEFIFQRLRDGDGGHASDGGNDAQGRQDGNAQGAWWPSAETQLILDWLACLLNILSSVLFCTAAQLFSGWVVVEDAEAASQDALLQCAVGVTGFLFFGALEPRVRRSWPPEDMPLLAEYCLVAMIILALYTLFLLSQQLAAFLPVPCSEDCLQACANMTRCSFLSMDRGGDLSYGMSRRDAHCSRTESCDDFGCLVWMHPGWRAPDGSLLQWQIYSLSVVLLEIANLLPVLALVCEGCLTALLNILDGGGEGCALSSTMRPGLASGGVTVFARCFGLTPFASVELDDKSSNYFIFLSLQMLLQALVCCSAGVRLLKTTCLEDLAGVLLLVALLVVFTLFVSACHSSVAFQWKVIFAFLPAMLLVPLLRLLWRHRRHALGQVCDLRLRLAHFRNHVPTTLHVPVDVSTPQKTEAALKGWRRNGFSPGAPIHVTGIRSPRGFFAFVSSSGHIANAPEEIQVDAVPRLDFDMIARFMRRRGDENLSRLQLCLLMTQVKEREAQEKLFQLTFGWNSKREGWRNFMLRSAPEIKTVTEWTELMILCVIGCAQRMRREQGQCLACVGDALLIACKYGHDACLRRLLNEWQADISVKDAEQRTPLQLACQAGHCCCVQRLLNHMGRSLVSQAARDEDVQAALKLACDNRNGDCVSLLLESGFTPIPSVRGILTEYKTRDVWAARILYTKLGTTEQTKEALGHELKLAFCEGEEATSDKAPVRYFAKYAAALKTSCTVGAHERTEQLLRKLPSHKKEENALRDALRAAFVNGHEECAKHILRIARSHEGKRLPTVLGAPKDGDMTALMLAYHHGNEKCAELLEPSERDWSLEDAFGNSALMHALAGGVPSARVPHQTRSREDAKDVRLPGVAAVVFANEDLRTEVFRVKHAKTDMRNLGLNATFVKAFSQAMPFNNLAFLLLSDNQIGDEGLKCLADALPDDDHKSKLPQLLTLDLADNDITATGIAALANVLLCDASLPLLKTLVLTRNAIGSRGFSDLAKVLSEGALPELRELQLEKCQINCTADLQLPQASLTHLKNISLKDNKLVVDDVDGLVEALQTSEGHRCALRELDVKGNHLDAQLALQDRLTLTSEDFQLARDSS